MEGVHDNPTAFTHLNRKNKQIREKNFFLNQDESVMPEG